jgi:hypothetical protein
MAQGQVNKQWVSAITYMDQRDIIPQIIDVTNESASLLDFLEFTESSFHTKESQYHQTTNTELFSLGVVASSSGAPGTTVTVVLTSGTLYAAIPGSIVYLLSGARASVQNNVAGTLTLVSIDGTNILAADVANGNSLSFPSVAFGEGSYGATPEKFPKNNYTNVAQIFKHAYEVSDIQLASKIEATVDDKDFFYQEVAKVEAYVKFRKLISLGLIMNTYSGDNFSAASYGLVDLNGKPVNSTRGLDQSITTMGITYPLITANTFSIPDLQAMDTTFNNIRAPKEYTCYASGPMNQYFDILINGINNSSQLSQAGRFMFKGETLDLAITNINIFNRVFHKLKLSELDDPYTIGNATGLGNIGTSMYLVPMGMCRVEGGGSLPYLSTRYMSTPRIDMRYFVQATGGMADPITSNQNVENVNFNSIQGLQTLGTNFFAKVLAA